MRVGLALSGGGFRAAAFHLGVLKRLEELRLLHRVEALSTVSGGSIIGALYALRCVEQGTGEPGSYPVEALIAEMRPVLTSNLRARALFGTPRRGAQTLWSVVSRRVSRIGLMIRELDRQLYHGVALDRLPPWIVINATNLRTGKAWKFYADRAGDYLAGATDRTTEIHVATAVAASAAYPGLTDSYAFTTRWEHLRGDLLAEERWERPPQVHPGRVSRWRERYGEPTGPVTFPLVDGGLYDNEGINGLRGRKVTHAILSGVTPPERDDASGFGPRRLLRLVEVVHDRLGAATRQLAHEMTHGVHPTDAGREAAVLAARIREAAADDDVPPTVRARLAALATRADTMAAVGTPPRGHQFVASAQVLLHRADLGRNAFAAPDRGGIDVPAAYRGLEPTLVAELSRVRTDLDALEPEVVDLLIAQGYFLTDFLAKLTMPDLVFPPETPTDWYSNGMAPAWEPAHAAVAAANANHMTTAERLRSAAGRSGLLGRIPRAQDRWRYRAVAVLVATPVGLAGLGLVACLLAGARVLVHIVMH